jgi:hypothetical protein
MSRGNGAMSNEDKDFSSAAKPLLSVVSEGPVPAESPKPSFADKSGLLTAEELAERLRLPLSWIRSHTRSRTTDEIPHHRFGRWIRFAWGSPELQRWLASHLETR